MNKTNRITKGTYSDFKIIKSRNVAQIIVEIPLEQSDDFIAMFGIPKPTSEKWVALAGLNEEVVDRNEKATKAIQICGMVCKDEKFGIFLRDEKKLAEVNPYRADTIADGLRALLGIRSRTELHKNDNLVAWNRLYSEYEQWCINQ